MGAESEQDAQHAEKAKERKSNQPMKSPERYARRNERNFSAVQNMSKVSEREKSKMMLNHTSNVIDKINDSYLPANYEANKMIQNVIQLVKTKKGAKISRYLHLGVKNSIHSVSTIEITFTWMNVWLSQRIYVPRS